MKAAVIFDRMNEYSIVPDNIKGTVIFIQNDPRDSVEVLISIKGLKDGNHGFHIHTKGLEAIKNRSDTIEKCCNLLGGHFNVGESWSLENPYGTKHGKHNGDLCFNIYSENNLSELKFFDDKISLYKEDPRCVLNRSLVIHRDMDDRGKGGYDDEEKNVQSLITGNAGPRIACGEIRLLN